MVEEWKPTWYLYSFAIVDFANQVVSTFKVQAKSDTEAMLAYLQNPLIQDFSKKEVARIVITWKQLEKFDPMRFLEPSITMNIPREEWTLKEE